MPSVTAARILERNSCDMAVTTVCSGKTTTLMFCWSWWLDLGETIEGDRFNENLGEDARLESGLEKKFFRTPNRRSVVLCDAALILC